MKKNLILLCLTFLVLNSGFAQKRIPLLEHFTNTKCGICGGQNPAFYSRVSMATQSSFHHISYHTKIPYSTCVLYAANKISQDARGTFYGLFGTPTVSINGKSLVSLSTVDNTTISQNATGTAAVSIDVSETSGTNRTATVKLTAHQQLNANGYKLYAALVERKLNYSAPNGESVHYNVFRKFVNTNVENGDALAQMNVNDSKSFDFNYTLDASWAADQMYVIAWVQSISDKTVLNSGSKYFKTTDIKNLDEISAGIELVPNPAVNTVKLQCSSLNFSNYNLEKVELFGLDGRLIRTENPTIAFQDYEMNVSNLVSGKYFVILTFDKGIAYKNLIISK